MTDTRYLYTVYPKKPIKGLPGIPVLRTSKSLHLNKDEVKMCLPLSSVYRRFANESRQERVYPSNLDRLHNAKFMDEATYVKYVESLETDTRGTTFLPPDNEDNNSGDEAPVTPVTDGNSNEEPLSDEAPVEEQKAPVNENQDEVTVVDEDTNVTEEGVVTDETLLDEISNNEEPLSDEAPVEEQKAPVTSNTQNPVFRDHKGGKNKHNGR